MTTPSDTEARALALLDELLADIQAALPLLRRAEAAALTLTRDPRWTDLGGIREAINRLEGRR